MSGCREQWRIVWQSILGSQYLSGSVFSEALARQIMMQNRNHPTYRPILLLHIIPKESTNA